MQYTQHTLYIHTIQHLPRLRGLNRRINTPLPASHSVEEELLGGQASEVGVLDEPTGLHAYV